MGAFVVIYGETGGGKSFVALDLALSLVTGVLWAGLRVNRCCVLYVVAEGGRGVRKRIVAWMKSRGVDPGEDARFLLRVVEMTAEGVEPLINALKDEGFHPDAIIVDTLARKMVGDENSAKDMGVFVKAGQTLQSAFNDAALIAVHHTGKPRADGSAPAYERGSSALRGAADTMIKVTFDKRTSIITVACDKQKDEEEMPPIYFRRQRVEVGVDEEGKPETSLVLVHEAGHVPARTQKDKNGLTAKALMLLKLLAAAPGGELTTNEWEKASKLSGGNYRKHREPLVNAKLVMETSKHLWTVLPRGSAIANGAPEFRHDPDVGTASANPTPVGGGVGGDVGDHEDVDPYDDWEVLHGDEPDEEEPK